MRRCQPIKLNRENQYPSSTQSTYTRCCLCSLLPAPKLPFPLRVNQLNNHFVVFSFSSFPPSLLSFLSVQQFGLVSICLSLFPVLRTTNRIGVLHVWTMPVISHFLQFEGTVCLMAKHKTKRKKNQKLYSLLLSSCPSLLPPHCSVQYPLLVQTHTSSLYQLNWKDGVSHDLTPCQLFNEQAALFLLLCFFYLFRLLYSLMVAIYFFSYLHWLTWSCMAQPNLLLSLSFSLSYSLCLLASGFLLVGHYGPWNEWLHDLPLRSPSVFQPVCHFVLRDSNCLLPSFQHGLFITKCWLFATQRKGRWVLLM